MSQTGRIMEEDYPQPIPAAEAIAVQGILAEPLVCRLRFDLPLVFPSAPRESQLRYRRTCRTCSARSAWPPWE